MKKKNPKADMIYYLHKYEGGYDEYKKTQIKHNKRKLNIVWADENVLSKIRDYLYKDFTVNGKVKIDCILGMCHGARNGFEVEWFNKQKYFKVIGTDISPTAKQFKDIVEWDFHKPKEEWHNWFSFVYTNSLDQAMDPQKAVRTWANQLEPKGLLFVEHTINSTPLYASDMDPFGAHKMLMPYLFFDWANDLLVLEDILKTTKANNRQEAWVFVLRKR